MTMRYIYYGTGLESGGDGLYCQAFDASTGDLGTLKAVAKGPSASFQAINADRTILYTMCDTDETKGGVRSYGIDQESGELSLISEQVAGGGKPCYVGLDRSERLLLVASYSDAVITVFPVEEDGEIMPLSFTAQHQGGTGVAPSRQNVAHAHSIYADPSNRYVMVCDLGQDKVVVYSLDAENGTLQLEDGLSVKTAPGAGPRHLAFHPNGEWVYVMNELNGTVTHYLWDAGKGALIEQGTVDTLPFDFDGYNITAEIVISQDGRFAYGTNRGHDSIVVYAIDEDTGALRLVQRTSACGKHPRNFNIDPSGKFLIVVNRESNNAIFFRIDQATGQIEATGVEVDVPDSICVRFG